MQHKNWNSTRIIIFLISLTMYSFPDQNKNVQFYDEIKNIRNRIDSIDNIINIYTKEKINYDFVYDLKIEKQLYQIAMDTLYTKKINEKIDSLTFSTIPFYTFRDPVLDSTYFVGYFDPAKAQAGEFLKLSAKKGCACNIETDRFVYGFANMHNRTCALEIDFEQFDRIGIYSMFPEVYGSVELLFSENKTLSDVKERLVKEAHRYNTKVDLVLSYHNWDTLYNLKPRIDQDAVIMNMVDSISSIVKMYEFDGITFDFDVGRMNLRDIIYYKKFIYMVNKGFEAKNRDAKINIIISTSDIFDTIDFSIVQIDSAYISDSQLNKKGKKVINALNRTKFNKLDLLLKPDLKEHIDYFIINNLTASSNLKTIATVLDTSYGIKNTGNKKVIIIVPLYTKLYRLVEDRWEYVTGILQKNYKKIKFEENSKNFLGGLDNKYVIDDLSIEFLEEKISNIWLNSMGLALWHIEYGDSTFYAMLHNGKYKILNEIYTPRIFVIKHFHAFRSFIDTYRISTGIIIFSLIVIYISFIVYSKLAGREKFVTKNRLYFIVSGPFFMVITYLYLITIPFDITLKFELILLAILFTILLIIAGYYTYKVRKSTDLP